MNLPAKVEDWPMRWAELWAERAGIIALNYGPECELDIRKPDPSGLRKIAESRAEQDIRKLAKEAK